jgi:DNA-binding CsgD family transcriptional regulator
MTTSNNEPVTPTGAKRAVKRLKAADRRVEVLDYRRAGLSIRQIATAMGISPTTAQHDIDHHMKAASNRATDVAVELFNLEQERLDDMLQAVYPQILAGDNNAIFTGLHIHDRRVKLLGLAPIKIETKQELSGPGGSPMKHGHQHEGSSHDPDHIAAVLSALVDAGVIPAVSPTPDTEEQ